MADITLARPCTLTLADGTQSVLAAGVHRNVSPEIAGHWFVQHHLVQEGAERPVSEATPLTHEERLKVTAAMEAAEGRARGAEAERDAAASQVEALTEALNAERAAHAETRALLEQATAPEGARETSGPVYTVHRAHQGKYKILKGEELVEDGLSKADADAKADALNRG